MVIPKIESKEVERQIRAIGKLFGDTNEAMICRWGVSVCRDLVKQTQAWGDDTKAKQKQQDAIRKDANRAVYSVTKTTYVNGVASGKLSGLVINGELITFTPDRVLKTAQEVVDFIDLNRTNRKNRVPTMKRNMKAIASAANVNKAVAIKTRRAGVAKGGWIGAGLAIAAKQRKGSKITIGKKVAGYAHKFKSGGTVQLTRSEWNPIGKFTNNIPYVSTDYVLKRRDAANAINEGGRKTVQWYQTALAARLKRKRK
jgi:hypothetical protein